MHIGHHVYTALRTLVTASRMQQHAMMQYFGDYHSMQWAKEMASINMRTARQSGHSNAIKELTEDLFHKSFVGFHNGQAAGLSGIKNFFVEGSLSRGTLDRSIRGIDLDAVIVDTASYFKPESIDKIYEIFLPHMEANIRAGKPFFFIFVQ